MINDILHLFFPNYCLACEEALFKHEELICTSCQFKLPYTNYADWPDNPVAKVFRGRVVVEHASSFLHFHKESRVQAMMHALKYKSQPEIGVLMGKWMGQKLKTRPELHNLDGIIPVPMHPRKQRKRGYNQCDFIAKGLSEAMNVPVYNKALAKVVNSKSQTRKARFTRWQNVQTVFQSTGQTELSNKHLLLIDDVVTTGATLEACAIELLQSENTKVSIATIAFA